MVVSYYVTFILVTLYRNFSLALISHLILVFYLLPVVSQTEINQQRLFVA